MLCSSRFAASQSCSSPLPPYAPSRLPPLFSPSCRFLSTAPPPLPTVKQLDVLCAPHLSSLTSGLASIRGSGSPSPDLFSKLQVEPYGPGAGRVSLESVGQVLVEPNRVTVTCFDAAAAQGVRRGIEENAALGLSPVVNGGTVTMEVKKLTGERRKEFVKMAKEMGEKCKIRVRDSRRDLVEACKKAVKDGAVGKDDGKKREKDIDDKVKAVNKKVEDLIAAKEKEIMG